MASLFKLIGRRGYGTEHLEEFKQTGVDVGGQPIFAHVVALEPASVGGGSGSTDITDRAARLLGHTTVDNPTLAVTQSGAWTSDVNDRAARLLGHVTVDNASLAVTGPLTDTQLRASAVTMDVNDRVARLLGHVTVDNATLAVTVSNPTTNPETGLAKDATLTSIVGLAVDSPASYTVLGRLTELRKSADARLQALNGILAATKPPVARKTQPTLLHRS